MRFTGRHLYRVRVVSYPEGAFTCIHAGLDLWEPTPGWQPPGWRPEGNYTQIIGTHEFVWPVTNKVYGSQSTAKRRADLLRSFGATAVVERSNRIEWPAANGEAAA